MNILICDDAFAFCNKISEAIISWFDGHEILAQCMVYTDPIEALNSADSHNYQIAFLDVEMQTLNGIELGRKLKQKVPHIIIVYVSAYLEFAIDGYYVDAFRYILKCDFERSLSDCLTDILKELLPQKHFPLKRGSSIINIPFSDIYYFESNLRKVYIYGNDYKESLGSFYDKLSVLTGKLDDLGFLRISRSHLVNMLHIRQIINYKVLLDNGFSLNTTRTNYSDIQQRYLAWKGQF